MNPYLEQSDLWQDFHDRYVPALGDALAALVRPRFFVKIEEHLFVHDQRDDTEEYTGNADVSVGAPPGTGDNGGGVGVIVSPMRVKVHVPELERQPYLAILDRQSRQVVTVVEVLRPTNKKSGALRRQFLYKRSQILSRWASYVEIDLLRGGSRMPLEPPPTCDYCVISSRYEDRPEVPFWPIGLREPLPPIPVPLPPPMDQVILDLQAVLHTVYDRAFYKDHIYGGKINPPLSPADAAWAAALISANS
jgi:hypothetical protein